MSLATRCPACGTVFRVVQDQLRVSDGWVRCGRCTEVFNAVEHMVDAATAGLGTPALDAAMRVGSGVGSAGSSAGTRQPWPGASMGLPGNEDDPGALDADLPTSDPAQPQHADKADEADTDVVPAIEVWADDADTPRPWSADGERASSALDTAAADTADATAADDVLAADPADRPTPPAGFAAAGAAPQAAAMGSPDAAARAAAGGRAHNTARAARRSGSQPAATPRAEAGAPLPSFLRQAERAERWRQPRVRAALAGACVLAALLLLGQAAHTWRDLLAARQPALRPLLAQSCAVWGCTLQPPRLIDALVVDSSALVRLERSNLYRLQVTLRNREAVAVAMPALDLSLTDSQGRLIVRRVLLAHELGASPDSLPAGTEQVLQATLQAEQATVAGYTIELFYP